MVAKRFGFSWGLRLCAVLFAGGFSLFAAFPSMFTLCLGYGILGGIGVGLSYNLVLNCISKWYLSGYGKVSGLLLMCFAGGSFVLSIVCNILIRAFGWRKTFLILAVIFACTILLCSFYIKHPSNDPDTFVLSYFFLVYIFFYIGHNTCGKCSTTRT